MTGSGLIGREVKRIMKENVMRDLSDVLDGQCRKAITN